MIVLCSLCGKKQEIGKIHKDYQRLAKNPKATFICTYCNNLSQIEANKEVKGDRKPV